MNALSEDLLERDLQAKCVAWWNKSGLPGLLFHVHNEGKRNRLEAASLAALDVLWSKLSELPDYFANHVDRLRLGASGLGNLEALGRMTDGGTEDPINWQGGVYSHALYTLPVTTKRATRS